MPDLPGQLSCQSESYVNLRLCIKPRGKHAAFVFLDSSKDQGLSHEHAVARVMRECVCFCLKLDVQAAVSPLCFQATMQSFHTIFAPRE